MRRLLAIGMATGLVLGCGATVKPPPSAQASARALAGRDAAGALLLARAGLADAPGNPWLRYDEGCALASLGRVDEALAALRDAEVAFPGGADRSLAIFRRAVVLEGAARCEEAVPEFRRYSRLVAPNDAVSADLAWRHIQLCRAAIPSPRPAPVAAASPLTSPLAGRAAAAIAAGDAAQGLALANRGLRAAPRDPWLLYDRGVALIQLGQVDEGADALEESERRFTDPADKARPAFRRALAYEQIGRCAEAARELRHYARLGGDTALVERHAQSCPGGRPWSLTQAPGGPTTR